MNRLGQLKFCDTPMAEIRTVTTLVKKRDEIRASIWKQSLVGNRQ